MADLTYGGASIPTSGNAVSITIVGVVLGLNESPFPPELPTLLGTAAKVIGSPVFTVSPGGQSIVTYSLSPTARTGETIKLSWPAGMVEDSAGNINVAFNEEPVTNNSAIAPDPPAHRTNHERIQSLLIDRGKAGPFHHRTFDATDRAEPINPFTATHIPPSSCRCNGGPETFDAENGNGKSLTRKRASWRFELMLRFDREVSYETFVEGLRLDPPTLPPDKDYDLPSVRLDLLSATPTQPVQGQPAGGTHVTFAFNAVTGRA